MTVCACTLPVTNPDACKYCANNRVDNNFVFRIEDVNPNDWVKYFPVTEIDCDIEDYPIFDCHNSLT